MLTRSRRPWEWDWLCNFQAVRWQRISNWAEVQNIHVRNQLGCCNSPSNYPSWQRKLCGVCTVWRQRFDMENALSWTAAWNDCNMQSSKYWERRDKYKLYIYNIAYYNIHFGLDARVSCILLISPCAMGVWSLYWLAALTLWGSVLHHAHHAAMNSPLSERAAPACDTDIEGH